MKNIEKYEKELRPFGTCFAITKDGKIKNCKGFRCEACAFHYVPDSNCDVARFEWLMKEYKKPILTYKEKAYLKSVIEPKKEEIMSVDKYWLASDNDGNVFYVVRVLQKDPIFGGSERMLLYFLTTEDMPFKGMELEREYSLKELGL